MIIEGNVITPDEGMTLTNGEVYSKRIHLGVNDSPENWWEIPDSEVPDPDEPATGDEATAEDYQAALKRLGVEV